MDRSDGAGDARLDDKAARADVHKYLPETYYVADLAGEALRLGGRVTAECVVRWADHYWARPLGNPSEQAREGRLPSPPDRRREFIGRIVDWLERATGNRMQFAALILSRKGTPVLDAYDGFPGEISLSPPQFDHLWQCWEQHRLPQDLYYPAQEQRSVVEPVEKYGSVVRMRRMYSPLEWARRQQKGVEALRVPTEEERRVRFARESDQYAQALMRRAFEFLEPGEARNPQASAELLKLAVEVQSLAHRTRNPQEPPPNLSD